MHPRVTVSERNAAFVTVKAISFNDYHGGSCTGWNVMYREKPVTAFGTAGMGATDGTHGVLWRRCRYRKLHTVRMMHRCANGHGLGN